jgi:hypothetical protein
LTTVTENADSLDWTIARGALPVIEKFRGYGGAAARPQAEAHNATATERTNRVIGESGNSVIESFNRPIQLPDYQIARWLDEFSAPIARWLDEFSAPIARWLDEF